MDIHLDEAGPRAHGRRCLLPAAMGSVNPYDGTGDAHSWIAVFREWASLYEWTEEDCLRIVKARCLGQAQRWVSNKRFNSWADFEQQFFSRFGETRDTALARLERCYQLPGESPKNFADRFLEEAERADRATDGALLHQFIRRLLPQLRREVQRQRPATIGEAIEFCNYWTDTGADTTEEDNYRSSYRPNDYPSRENRPARDGPLFPRNSDRNNRFDNQPGVRRNDRWDRQGDRDGYRRTNDNYNRLYRGPQRSPAGAYNSYGSNNFRRDSSAYNRPHGSNNNGPNTRPFNPPAQQQNRPANVTTGDVDDLTRQMERMQINNMADSVALREANQEIHRLKAALRRREVGSEHIGILEDAGPSARTTSEPYADYYQEDSGPYTDYDELMIKRAADQDNAYVRMPHKRVAFDPAAPGPYTQPRRMPTPPAAPEPPAPTGPPARPTDSTHTTNLEQASRRIPRQRAPFNAAPYGTGAANVSTKYDAATLAKDKGREMAEQFGKIKLDGRKESAVLPRAVMYCAAGYMLGDMALVDKGMKLAKEVENVTTRVAPGHTILLAADRERHPAAYLANYSERPMKQVMSYTTPPNKKLSTVKIRVRVAGYDTWAVVDTGASTNAITLDCLRRAKILHLIRRDLPCGYINADGCYTDGKGRVYNVPLSIGNRMATLQSFTVTEALNYDVILSTELLDEIEASIHMADRTMTFQVDSETTDEVPISLAPSDGAPASVSLLQEVLSETQQQLPIEANPTAPKENTPNGELTSESVCETFPDAEASGSATPTPTMEPSPEMTLSPTATPTEVMKTPTITQPAATTKPSLQTALELTLEDADTEPYDDDNFTELPIFYQFMDVVYQLPPAPPECIGWERTWSDNSTDHRGRYFRAWLRRYQFEVDGTEAILMTQVSNPPPANLLSLISDMKVEANTYIQEGEYCTQPYSAWTIESSCDQEYILMMETQQMTRSPAAPRIQERTHLILPILQKTLSLHSQEASLNVTMLRPLGACIGHSVTCSIMPHLR